MTCRIKEEKHRDRMLTIRTEHTEVRHRGPPPGRSSPPLLARRLPRLRRHPADPARAVRRRLRRAMSLDLTKLTEKKQALEEELARTEKQIYDLEADFLQETLKEGNILRGWEGYLGTQSSSGAIRRINRFREADRMFSGSSCTSGASASFGPAKAAGGGGGGGGGAKMKKRRRREEEDE